MELLPCPFCGATVDEAFENLVRDDEDDEPRTVYTIHHKCPVTLNSIWCEGSSKDSAHTAWNHRRE